MVELESQAHLEVGDLVEEAYSDRCLRPREPRLAALNQAVVEAELVLRIR